MEISAAGSGAVIPSLGSRAKAIPYDARTYRERNLVERFFRGIQQFRRVAARNEQTVTSFAAMLYLDLAAASAWLS